MALIFDYKAPLPLAFNEGSGNITLSDNYLPLFGALQRNGENVSNVRFLNTGLVFHLMDTNGVHYMHFCSVRGQ